MNGEHDTRDVACVNGPTMHSLALQWGLQTRRQTPAGIRLVAEFDRRERVNAEAAIRAAREAVASDTYPRPMALASSWREHFSALN